MKNSCVVRVLACIVLPLSDAIGIAQSSTATIGTRNEVGLVIGATETPSVALQSGGEVNHNSSLALGIEYDRKLLGRRTQLLTGVDFLASPFDVKASFPAENISPQYAYLFLSPHVKVKFNGDGTWQPWLLFGGGYANFSPAQPRTGGVKVTGAGSTGTLEFGVGVDTRPLITLKGLPLVGTLPIGARLEAKDFYSGQPKYGVSTQNTFQNNIVFAGGLVLRF